MTPQTRSRLEALSLGSLKLVTILFGVAVVVHLLLVAWLHHHLSSQAISITQAVGLPSDAERVFGGALSWLFSFVLAFAFIRLVLEALNPFRSSSKFLSRLAILIALAFAATLLPHGIRKLRGVDHAGLPVHMQTSDPVRAIWWNPDGDPVLFQTTEDDGTLRFWNRPGIAPDTGLEARPVTRPLRAQWERSRRDASAEEARRLEAEETQRQAEADEQARQTAARDAERNKWNSERQALARAAADAAEKLAAEKKALALTEKQSAERLAAEQQRARQAEEAKRLLQEKLDKAREQTKSTPSPRPSTPVNSRMQSNPNFPSPSHQSTTTSRPAPSDWITVPIHPRGFFTANGAPNSRIEIRSNGHGLFHAPGSSPVPFSGGTHSFHANAPQFRLVGRETESFLVTFRWLPQ